MFLIYFAKRIKMHCNYVVITAKKVKLKISLISFISCSSSSLVLEVRILACPRQNLSFPVYCPQKPQNRHFMKHDWLAQGS